MVVRSSPSLLATELLEVASLYLVLIRLCIVAISVCSFGPLSEVVNCRSENTSSQEMAISKA